MKKLFSLTAVLVCLVLTIQAQTGAKIPAVLTQYYAVKNSLVAGDAARAGTSATEFVKAVNAVDTKTLTATEQKLFQSLQAKLLADAGLIAASKDIAKQREIFALLSTNMISLAKTAKISDATIYVDYCPMKKSSWLSEDKSIKNPYYGSSMLACGSVKEMIKQ
jgi:DNA-binding transcriptional regulator WhiA